MTDLASARGGAPLPRSTIWIYGSLGLPLAVIGYPIAIWVIPHYSGALGVSLAAVGSMLMLARISDVVTDPLIGVARDLVRTRLGGLQFLPLSMLAGVVDVDSLRSGGRRAGALFAIAPASPRGRRVCATPPAFRSRAAPQK